MLPPQHYLLSLLILSSGAVGCDDCYGPIDLRQHERIVRRMQPDAHNATAGPSRPLEWGQIQFLHTTDTHGWLEGHIKDQNYGADFGDWVSFTKNMKSKAAELKVDLLLVDTGDLHDGAGLSDLSPLNGEYSNVVFENVPYDLATIGNHELGVADIAYETFQNFSRFYGDRYLTTNVQILNTVTHTWDYIGRRSLYFTTPHGLRILAIGCIFDFTGNTNVTKVTKAADLVKEAWFNQTVGTTKPVDLFLIIGHNAVRPTDSTSSMGTLYGAVRALRPHTPIQVLGGHTHVRDFVVYDEMGTGIESGRYCETFGWVSITGIQSDTYFGVMNPTGVPNPSKTAVKVNVTSSSGLKPYTTQTSGTQSNSGTLLYSRRYLDWNRRTMMYHANSSLAHPFDIDKGIAVSHRVTELRNKLNLTSGSLFGCAPQTWCMTCKPFGSPGNIYTLLTTALAEVVVNETRKAIPRIVLLNTGVVRYDLLQGVFTRDDADIVTPFDNPFEYIPGVPFQIANQVLTVLNSPSTSALPGRRDLQPQDFNFQVITGDTCPDASNSHFHSHDTSSTSHRRLTTRGIIHPRADVLSPGYHTTDDFGTDGDDTPHLFLPSYKIPTYFGTNASFPADSEPLPGTVDLIFTSEFSTQVLQALKSLGGNYSPGDVLTYEEGLSANNYLIEFALREWQANVPNCPTGMEIGT